MTKPWSLPNLYRGSSYRKLVATPSPKKHKAKDAYPNTSDSSVSATSISGDSLSSLEKSPFGLSIPDLEESSGSEMTMMPVCLTSAVEAPPALHPPAQAQLVKPVKGMTEDFTKQVSPPSLSGINSLASVRSPTTRESTKAVNTDAEERVLWMPPLNHLQDTVEKMLELPESSRRLDEKSAKEPKKHNRKSSTGTVATISSLMGWLSPFEGGGETNTSIAPPKEDNPFLSGINHWKLKMQEGEQERGKVMQTSMRLSPMEVEQAFTNNCDFTRGVKEEEKGIEPPPLPSSSAATTTDVVPGRSSLSTVGTSSSSADTLRNSVHGDCTIVPSPPLEEEEELHDNAMEDLQGNVHQSRADEFLVACQTQVEQENRYTLEEMFDSAASGDLKFSNDEHEMETSPGVFLPFRGVKETWQAVTTNCTVEVQCIDCRADLVCINDCEFTVCPNCRFANPVFCDENLDKPFGVRMGFKKEWVPQPSPAQGPQQAQAIMDPASTPELLSVPAPEAQPVPATRSTLSSDSLCKLPQRNRSSRAARKSCSDINRIKKYGASSFTRSRTVELDPVCKDVAPSFRRSRTVELAPDFFKKEKDIDTKELQILDPQHRLNSTSFRAEQKVDKERINSNPVKPRSTSALMYNSPSMLHAIRRRSTTTNKHQMPELPVKVEKQEDNDSTFLQSLTTRHSVNPNSFQKAGCERGRTKPQPDKPRSTIALMGNSPSKLRAIGRIGRSSKPDMPELPVRVEEQETNNAFPQSIGTRYSLNSASFHGEQKVQKVDSHPVKPRSASLLMSNSPSMLRAIRRLGCSSKPQMHEPPVVVKDKPKRHKSGGATQKRCSTNKPPSLRNLSHRGNFKLGANGLSSLLKPSSRTHGPVRTSSKNQQGSGSSVMSSSTELNIFCSEMVSTDFVLSQINEAKHNSDIVTLEIEDLLENFTCEIALALEDLLNCDDRPWEGVHFVDEVQLDGSSSYRPWMQRKRYLVNVGNLKLIPIKLTTRVTVQDKDDKPGDEASDSGLVALLQDLQKDASVTVLRFSTKNSTRAIVEELTNLFQCDNRKWKSVQLNLTGAGPFSKGSNEHAEWCKEMQASGMLMQKVAQERGILLE